MLNAGLLQRLMAQRQALWTLYLTLLWHHLRLLLRWPSIVGHVLCTFLALHLIKIGVLRFEGLDNPLIVLVIGIVTSTVVLLIVPIVHVIVFLKKRPLLTSYVVSVTFAAIVGHSLTELYLGGFDSTLSEYVTNIFALFTNFLFAWILVYMAEQTRSIREIAAAMSTYKEQTQDDQKGLFEKLRPAPGAEILEVWVRDKLLHVRTATGTQVLRMSLSNALEDIPSSQGIRIHRSNWLRFSEIKSILYVQGNPKVILRDESERPMSRSAVEGVRVALEQREKIVKHECDIPQ